MLDFADVAEFAALCGYNENNKRIRDSFLNRIGRLKGMRESVGCLPHGEEPGYRTLIAAAMVESEERLRRCAKFAARSTGEADEWKLYHCLEKSPSKK